MVVVVVQPTIWSRSGFELCARRGVGVLDAAKQREEQREEQRERDGVDVGGEWDFEERDLI